MKKVKYIYKSLPVLFAMLCLSACDNEIQDIPKVEEKLELTASSAAIALDEKNLSADIITFTWTPARELPADYLVSYTTKLDVVGNNFGSSTVIMGYEDDGIFSKSFTSEQLNNWANEKWKLKVNKPFTLEFRVVAEWNGGPTFESPEVRTFMVEVQPIKVEVFAADKMFMDGSAIPDGSKIEMTKTVENESQYAWYGDLVAGELKIPVSLEGETFYIVPEDGNGALQDGVAESVKMRENMISWTIPTAGKYRVVVNMEKSTVTICSPAKPMAPAVVKWLLNSVEQTTEVNNIWEYGEPTGWAWRTGSWKQSMADPQVFIYSGVAMTGRTKFGVAANNVAYVYTGNNTGANTAVTLGTEYPLYSGYSANERNAYFTLPAGTNFIILDIRNMKMKAFKK